jgi:hypothetical protein
MTAKIWFLNLLGFIYLVAFSSVYIQKPGLYGNFISGQALLLHSLSLQIMEVFEVIYSLNPLPNPFRKGGFAASCCLDPENC